MERTALVTGGAGFLGGHLADHLVAHGWRVRVLDLNEPEISHLQEWVDADVRDEVAMRHAARGVDVVFHLGSVVGVDRLLDDPVACIDVTVNGTRAALEAAGAAGASLVHVSTSEVLGSGSEVPWAEDADRVLGDAHVDRWSYAAAKAAAEHLVLAGAPSRAVAATVIRPFNVYGPRQDVRFVVPLLVGAALRGEPLPVHGSGEQTRCFTYVDDVVAGLAAVGERPGAVRVLHLGSTAEVTINQLADAVEVAVGRPCSRVSLDPASRWGDRFADVVRRRPDVRLAREAFGWEARVPLAEGLARTVSWFRSLPPGERSAAGPATLAP